MEIESLRKFLLQIYPLEENELEALLSGWQSLTLKRKSLLTVAGETERYLYFVLEGVQRAFYLAEDGKEATIVFTYAPSFSGVADSFLTQTPSLYFLETITASRFLRIEYRVLKSLMDRHTGINALVFKATSLALKAALLRQIELQSFSSEEKFKAVLGRSPHILNLVPHKYLASYLGIDPTNFSKLLASVRI